MQRYEIYKIIFSSTAAVYGIPETTPITINALEYPINSYGRSKIVVEWMLRDYETAYDIKWIALRYFNAAGADPGGEVGEAHEHETHLIPIILKAIEDWHGLVMVNGDDYHTPDGTCVRDYIHVTDLAQAHLLALRELISKGASGVFNLGNGSGYSIRDILDSAELVTHQRVPVKFGTRRVGDPAILVADATRARYVLGWSLLHSELDEIILTACDWLRTKQSQTTRISKIKLLKLNNWQLYDAF
jgi:UDP-glucose-4-epimerase GalE